MIHTRILTRLWRAENISPALIASSYMPRVFRDVEKDRRRMGEKECPL